MITNMRNLSLFCKKSDYFQKNIYIDIEKEGLSYIVFGWRKTSRRKKGWRKKGWRKTSRRKKGWRKTSRRKKGWRRKIRRRKGWRRKIR